MPNNHETRETSYTRLSFKKFHWPATRYERQATFFEQFAQKMPLHLSRELYKSTLFLQNEPNFKIAQIYTSPYNKNSYINFRLRRLPKNEPKRTQNEPNFGPKLASFSKNLALFDNEIFAFANNLNIFADLQMKNAVHFCGLERFYCNIVFLLTLTKRMRKRFCGRLKFAFNARIKEQIGMSTPKSAKYPVILSKINPCQSVKSVVKQLVFFLYFFQKLYNNIVQRRHRDGLSLQK